MPTNLVRMVAKFACLWSFAVFAETGSSGRGGPFLEYHATNLSNFDSGVSGTPLVIGGVGFGSTSKNFRLGGGGGGGFLWNGSDNLAFGIGYGGIVGEYIITNWLSARMLIGGGGYAVSKILSQTDTTVTTQKINSGGFLLFHPSVFFQVRLGSACTLGANLGYFLPNVGKLHSFTAGLNLLIGK
jgi:hypothetical protein